MTDLWVPGEELQKQYATRPSGLIVPEALAAPPPSSDTPVKAMEFFAGAGGIGLGFKQAGIEVVAASELWPTAVLTYMTNLCRFGEVQMHFVEESDRAAMEKELKLAYKRYGVRIEDGELVQDEKFHGAPVPFAGSGWISHHPDVAGTRHMFIGDCRQLTSQRILDTIGMEKGELDIVAGGPPCQGYSISGKRQVADPRNNLVFEYARLIVELAPKTMMMENVPGILTMVTPEGDDVVTRFCRILEDGGFGTLEALDRQIRAKAGTMGILRQKHVEKPASKKAPKAEGKQPFQPTWKAG